MTTHTHLGHIFHIAGEPTVTEAAAALESIPDGALVLDDSGRIVFCGNRTEIPAAYESATMHDHRFNTDRVHECDVLGERTRSICITRSS